MKTKLHGLEFALLSAPFVAVALFWNRLPERVPIHWNLHGVVDGWAAKPFGLLLLPVTSVVVVGLFHLIPRLDPRMRRAPGEYERTRAVLQIFSVVLAAFFAVISSMQIAAALGRPMPVARIVPGSVLLLMAVIGNFLANLRPNYFAGLRTPWTLESAETWRATHRAGARLMFFGSLGLLLLLLLLDEKTFVALFCSAVLGLVLWTFWFSWHHYHVTAGRSDRAHRELN